MTQATRTDHLHELANIIRLLFWHGQKQAGHTLERLGMTTPQAMVLLGLETNGGQCTMSELVQVTQQSPGTLTGIVDRLIAARFVERDRDAEDRRVVWVRLTDAGQAKITTINAEREADITQMTTTFDDAEIAQFTGLMGRLLQAVEAKIIHDA